MLSILTWFILPEYSPRSKWLFIDSDEDSILSRDLSCERDLHGTVPLQRGGLHHVRDLSIATDGHDLAVECVSNLELIREAILIHQL